MFMQLLPTYLYFKTLIKGYNIGWFEFNNGRKVGWENDESWRQSNKSFVFTWGGHENKFHPPPIHWQKDQAWKDKRRQIQNRLSKTIDENNDTEYVQYWMLCILLFHVISAHVLFTLKIVTELYLPLMH